MVPAFNPLRTKLAVPESKFAIFIPPRQESRIPAISRFESVVLKQKYALAASPLSFTVPLSVAPFAVAPLAAIVTAVGADDALKE